MNERHARPFGRKLLCIAPPYGNRAPAGSAYLLGYLKAQGCLDYDFLDLRLEAPFDFTPTYRTTGSFGESYVLDVPDLPLALMLIDAFQRGTSLVPEPTPLFERYCIERGMSPRYLQRYLGRMDRYLAACFAQLPEMEVIGFSTFTPNYLFTLLAAAHLKRRPKPPIVIAGGPQVTSSAVSAALGLRSGLFDVVANSDGEETLLELELRISRGAGLTEVPGTSWLDAPTGEIRTLARKTMKMESLPVPSFEEMPLGAYQTDADLLSLPFQLSRGCTDRCSFCSEWVFWRHYRSDTPEHAVGQLKELQRRYGMNFIEFSDSLLNGHHKRLVAFAEQVLREKLEFGWTAFMRAQTDKETAALLARAGCNGVFIGIESFSDETLQLMNKRRTEADNIAAVRTFVEAGILVTAGFIPGFPGDSREGFLHSVTVLRELQDRYPGKIQLHEEPFTLMANAPLYRSLGEVGLLPVRWADDYLDILPGYRDVTSEVLCSVEGSAQGIERIGRMAIVGAVKSDAPVRSTFEEGTDENLPLQGFDFEHVHGSSFLAKHFSRDGHRYALLVSEDEYGELQALADEVMPLEDLHAPAVARVLGRLERAHAAPPVRGGPRVARALYRRDATAQATFAVPPYVIARRFDDRRGAPLLVADCATGRTHLRAASEEALFRRIAKRPARLADLRRLGLQGMRRPAVLARVLDELKELGLLVVREVEECAQTQVVDDKTDIAGATERDRLVYEPFAEPRVRVHLPMYGQGDE